MKGFWKELKRPISILAPMYDVTDVVFRSVVCSTSRPDVFFTEFVNCDAFLSRGKGHELAAKKLKFTKEQRPIVAQIWGKDPEKYYKMTKELVELGFDGIDINMGCPERTEMKLGVCAALIENQPLAHELISATIEAAGTIPVSVKTRTGVKTTVTEDWISFLLSHDLSAITLHARTAKQMSEVDADWTQIKIAVGARNKLRAETLLIGNGDVQNYNHGVKLCADYGCDGFMIGRGIFKDIYAFSEKAPVDLSIKKRLELLKYHVNLYRSTYGEESNFSILKKFVKIYIQGFDDAATMRSKFMLTESFDELLTCIDTY